MDMGVLSGLVSGVDTVVFDTEVTGSAVSSISTGNILNGDEDGWYTIIVRGVCSTGISEANDVGFQFNGDTGTNYGRRVIYATNTSVGDNSFTGLTSAQAGFCYDDTSNFFSVTRLYAKSGAVRLANTTYAYGISTTTVTALVVCGTVWNNTADNLVSLSLVHGGTGTGFGVGTRIIILKSNNFTNGTPYGAISTPYIKGAWVRVGSQILSSAASSVTFSGLDGDRDVVYYVSTSIKSAANGNSILLRLNGDNTADIYGRQYLGAVSTTVEALRATGSWIYMSYIDTTNYYGQGNAIIFAKTGFVRPAIVTYLRGVTATTVTQITIQGWSYNQTSSNITNIVIGSDQANGMAAGSQIDLYALRPGA